MFSMILLVVLMTKLVDGKVSSWKIGRYIDAIKDATATARELYETLKNENDLTTSKVIVTFIKAIPVIGEIVQLFTDDTSDISHQLDGVKDQLIILSENQDTIIQEIKNLHRQILFMPIKNEITTRSVDINSCVTDLNNFLRQPELMLRQNDLKKCGDSIKPGLRFIADLLKEDKYTKVFEEIIKTDTFCNGSKIMVMHKYLYSLLVTGCEAVITSEVVTYNRSSMLEECNSNFLDINNHFRQIFHGCTHDSCDTIITILRSTLLKNIDKPTKQIWQAVISIFPWFKFQLFEFATESKVTFVGNKAPSSVTFQYNATRQFFITWTPYETRNNPDNYTIGFAYEVDSKDIFDMFTNMNITTYFTSRPVLVMGYIEDNTYVSSNICINSIQQMFEKEKNGTNSLSSSFHFELFMGIVAFILSQMM